MNKTNLFITALVGEVSSNKGKFPMYREPLVGFAEAKNPLFAKLKTIIAPDHLVPSDLLPTAQSVVSFFLPFAESIVRGNQNGTETSQGWAIAKKETDETIHEIIQVIRQRLAGRGIACSANPALAAYDPTRFMHRWSQRHVGYICGLGNFGLNQLLITESGCAGRLGSFCIDAPVLPIPVQDAEVCPYKINGSCGVCVSRCPSGALQHSGIDKPTCSAWINDFTERRFAGNRVYRSCGKCIALPCALKRPSQRSA